MVGTGGDGEGRLQEPAKHYELTQNAFLCQLTLFLNVFEGFLNIYDNLCSDRSSDTALASPGGWSILSLNS